MRHGTNDGHGPRGKLDQLIKGGPKTNARRTSRPQLNVVSWAWAPHALKPGQTRARHRRLPELHSGGRLARERVRVPPAHLLPIHDVPPSLDVVRAPELVLQVVRVLPDVAAEDRDARRPLHAFHKRIVLIRRGSNGQLVVLRHDQPHPARSEARARRPRRRKLGLEIVHGAEGLADGRGQLVGGRAASSLGRHLQPEEVVIVGAAAAVAERGARLDGRLLQLHQRRLRLALERLVDVRHVRQVVLVVVEFHRGLVDRGLQRVIGVRQRRELVGVGRRRRPRRAHQRPDHTARQHVAARGRSRRPREHEVQVEALADHCGTRGQRNDAPRAAPHVAALRTRHPTLQWAHKTLRERLGHT
mmetsp:Transcript_52485/g.159508  ORF Transcript_52485/g.159508 Transcript_52485/m.159508 type:complete len:359 (+) Transcript_52485:67-1143(+)